MELAEINLLRLKPRVAGSFVRSVALRQHSLAFRASHCCTQATRDFDQVAATTGLIGATDKGRKPAAMPAIKKMSEFSSGE